MTLDALGAWANAIFGRTGEVTALQECARAALLLIYGLVLVRLAGRRVFGKWAALDIVVAIVVGSNLSRALTGSAALGGTILATTLLMGLHWIFAQASARWKPVSRLLEGECIELAVGGEARRSSFAWQSISENDLAEALRQAGVEHLSQTRLVTLEPSGRITVLKSL